MDPQTVSAVEGHLAPIRASLGDLAVQLAGLQRLLVDLDRRLMTIERRPEPDSFAPENLLFINAEGKTE